MKYMLMCCFDEQAWAELADSERHRIMAEYGELIKSWAKSGRLLTGAKLDPVATAVTVRHEGGQPKTTDGPFAETKEQLGGYHVVECGGHDEAVSLATQIPTLPAGGAIEVRRVMNME
jgi:hypothetical protein